VPTRSPARGVAGHLSVANETPGSAEPVEELPAEEPPVAEPPVAEPPVAELPAEELATGELATEPPPAAAEQPDAAAEQLSALAARVGRLETAAERIADLSARLDWLGGEVAALHLRLETIATFERFHDLVLTRHASQPYRPPAAGRLDARDFQETTEGVYSLEYDPNGVAFRWTGPGQFTRFSFFVDRSVPLRVHLTLLLPGRLTETDVMAADIDGVAYPFAPTGSDGTYVAGPVPPRAGGVQTDVLLHVPVLFTPEGGGDNRRLGVAFTSIALEPAA